MKQTTHERDVYEYAATLVDYDPLTGQMIWRKRHGDDRETKRWNTRHAGKHVAGLNLGYFHLGVTMDGKSRLLKAHRLSWFIVHGHVPSGQIDHIDRVRTNNAISNLRSVSNAENLRNKSKYKTNTSGFVGVTLNAQRGTWRARVPSGDGKRAHIGTFKDAESAARAVNDQRAILGLAISTPLEAQA